jgi:hypothetical protein
MRIGDICRRRVAKTVTSTPRGREVNKLIECIPTVHRLSLFHTGPWGRAMFEFALGLNIITGRSGSGRTTILCALTAPAAAPSRPTPGQRQERVEIEYLGCMTFCQVVTPGPLPQREMQSDGQRVDHLVDLWIDALAKGGAVLLDEAVIGLLDDTHADRLIKRLEQAPFQAVVVLPLRIDTNRFCARIFECQFSSNAETATFTMKDTQK